MAVENLMTQWRCMLQKELYEREGVVQWQMRKAQVFLSQRLLDSTKLKSSTPDRELLGRYLLVRHFQHLLVARQFNTLTGHKPLTCAMYGQSNLNLPRVQSHLSYILAFTTDIQRLGRKHNAVADAIS